MDMVTEHWQRIDTWLQTFAPTRAADLLPGVTEEEIAEAEARLGLTLPADFKASYRLHNGARGDSYLLMGYPYFSELSLVRSFGDIFHDLLQDTRWAQTKPKFLSDPLRQSLPIQPVWCHPHWVTFAGDADGFLCCIDLAPAKGGTWGQVIAWDHEVGPDFLFYPSFQALLAAYADQLEAGLYLGRSPIIPLARLKHLKERRVAFQQPSPAKSILHQAMRSAWQEDIDLSLETFREVLQMEAATAEDRFFAYYGLITCCLMDATFEDEIPSFFAQLENEARKMPTTHWVHEEVALLP